MKLTKGFLTRSDSGAFYRFRLKRIKKLKKVGSGEQRIDFFRNFAPAKRSVYTYRPKYQAVSLKIIEK